MFLCECRKTNSDLCSEVLTCKWVLRRSQIKIEMDLLRERERKREREVEEMGVF